MATILHQLVAERNWAAVADRARSHPQEAKVRRRSSSGRRAGPDEVYEDESEYPLHAACHVYPCEKAVRALLDAFREAVVAQNSDGETPLHLALVGASTEVQVMLLQCGGHAVSKADKYGDSPLHLAASSGVGTHLIRLMIRADPTVVNLPNNKGETPFFLLGRSYERATSVMDVRPGSRFGEDWEKAMLFLRAIHFGTPETPAGQKVPLMHAAAAARCPRVLIRAIGRLFPEQALYQDSFGRTPLAVAAAAGVYCESNVGDACSEKEANDGEDDDEEEGDGEDEEEHDVEIHEQDAGEMLLPEHDPNQVKHQTVIEILLRVNKRAAEIPDRLGRMPLFVAIETQKEWKGGIHPILVAAPAKLELKDPKTLLYPFMLASVGSGSSHDTAFNLLRENPAVLSVATHHFLRRQVVSGSAASWSSHSDGDANSQAIERR